jgi:hypothetical protein
VNAIASWRQFLAGGLLATIVLAAPLVWRVPRP